LLLFVCLFVCMLTTLRKNFQMDLHEIFGEGWQWNTSNSDFMLWVWKQKDE